MSEIPKDFYVNLGSSGLKISKIVLGCMSYGSKQWQDWVIDDEEEVFTLMKSAYDAGIRTFDTADTYSGGVSEELVGKFIKKYDIPRESLVIMTKCYNYVSEVRTSGANFYAPRYVNKIGLSRKHIFDAVEASVKRLGTYIDVLQIHRYDRTTPAEETMRALHDVIATGDVRYIGASSMYAYQFIELQTAAEKNGWTKFISMQNFYNLIYREEEREMIPYCKKNGIGLIPWSPIAGGALARPYDQVSATKRGQALMEFLYASWEEESTKTIVARVEEVAKKRGVSMAVIATAWTIAKGTQPIVGITKLDRIDDAIKAAKISLSEEEIKYLEESYKPVAIIGH